MGSSSDELGSISALIERLQNSDPAAAAELWTRFEQRLIRYIVHVLRSGPVTTVNEGAISNSVFEGLLQLARQGKLANVRRDEFWKLTKVIAKRRVIDRVRRDYRQKRGSGTVVTESVIRREGAAAHEFLDQFPGQQVPPDIVAMTEELLSQIEQQFTQELWQILDLRMQGTSLRDIATAINKSVPTVERKLRTIRQILKEKYGLGEGPDGPG